MKTFTCTSCGQIEDALTEFPGGRCLECWRVTPEALRTPTADELVAMWGGNPRLRKG